MKHYKIFAFYISRGIKKIEEYLSSIVFYFNLFFLTSCFCKVSQNKVC